LLKAEKKPELTRDQRLKFINLGLPAAWGDNIQTRILDEAVRLASIAEVFQIKR
jgi:hypothetical protein